VKPPKKDVAPADITLDETPDAPHKKKKAHPKKPPKAESPEPPPEKEPEVAPAPTREEATKPASAKKSTEGDGEDSKDDKKKDNGDGLLGPFRIGIILGTGLPSIVSFGGMIKLTRYFGAGVNVGLIPSIRLAYYGEADLAYQEYDVYGHIFPFGGAFFAGAGVGYAHVSGTFNSPPFNTSAYQSMLPPGVLPNPIYITSEASVRVMVLTPTIGLLHTFGSGFTIGIDAGAQIPIAPSETRFETTLTLPSNTPRAVTDEFERNKQNVRDTLDTVSRTIIPTLMLRLGWLI
jgi:hypothetical protein